LKAQKSFKEFWDNRELNPLRKRFTRAFCCAISSQADTLIAEGKVLVDFIGRFESIQNDYDKVCDVIGAPKQMLGKYLATQKDAGTEHYSCFYDNESKEIVAEIYKDDIERFRYDFQQ